MIPSSGTSHPDFAIVPVLEDDTTAMIVRNRFPHSSIPAFALLAFALSASPDAKASLISVQFGCTAGSSCAGAGFSSAQQTGAAVIGSPGDVWNLVSGNGGLGTTGSNVPLLDATGALTGVTVSWNSALAWVVQPGDESGFGSGPDAALMSAYLVDVSSNAITISGLAPTANYALYMYTQVPVFGSGRQASFSVNGGSPVIAAPGDQNASTFINGQNYEVFNTAADSLGNITIDYSAYNGEADVNGFQLSDTPEPGELGMAAGAIALLIGWRRRNRAQA